MTIVIAAVPLRAYAAVMGGNKGVDALNRLLVQQRALETRTAAAHSPGSVIELGHAVLEFASFEEQAFFPLLPLLDPEARAELGGEHEHLAEDLELLEWLVSTTPDSPDVTTLTEALAHRMHAHVARDGRLLAQAVRLAERTGQAGL